MADQDQEFELVLGNKQILSFFFLVILLFGVFFFFGYSVGYDRAESDRELAMATVEPIVESPDAVRVPDALLKKVPSREVAPEVAPSAEAVAPDPGRARVTPASRPVPTAEKPRPFRELEPAAGSRKPAAVDPAVVARSIHLQVAALRVQSDGRLLADKLSAKGYPAMLFNQGGDGWVRVLVGPFRTTDAAKEYRRKLKAEGFDSILRKP